MVGYNPYGYGMGGYGMMPSLQSLNGMQAQQDMGLAEQQVNSAETRYYQTTLQSGAYGGGIGTGYGYGMMGGYYPNYGLLGGYGMSPGMGLGLSFGLGLNL